MMTDTITDDTNQMDVNLDLSQAELLDVLRFLEVEAFLGLDVEAVRKMPDERRAFMFRLARNALAARKIMARDANGEWKLDPLVLTMVGICAVPDRSVIMTHQQPDRAAEGYFFHTSTDSPSTILHKTDGSDIHQFYLLREERPIITAIKNVLQIESAQAPEAAPARLPEAVMTQARDAALAGGEKEAALVLEAGGVSAETAQSLAQTLAHPTAFTTIAQIIHRADENEKTRRQDGFTLLHGAGTLWLAQPQVTETGQVTDVVVAPSETPAIWQRVAALVDEA